MTARRIVLASRPVGMLRPENFRIEDDQPLEPGPGEFLIANHILSIDPAIRGFLDDRPSYLPPVAIGETIIDLMSRRTMGKTLVRTNN